MSTFPAGETSTPSSTRRATWRSKPAPRGRAMLPSLRITRCQGRPAFSALEWRTRTTWPPHWAGRRAPRPSRSSSPSRAGCARARSLCSPSSPRPCRQYSAAAASRQHLYKRAIFVNIVASEEVLMKTCFLFPGQGAQYPGMARDFSRRARLSEISSPSRPEVSSIDLKEADLRGERGGAQADPQHPDRGGPGRRLGDLRPRARGQPRRRAGFSVGESPALAGQASSPTRTCSGSWRSGAGSWTRRESALAARR